MNLNIVSVILVVAILVSGCATTTPLADNQVKVTYNSQPRGALLYDAERGTAWGIEPQTRIYTLSSAENGATVAVVTAVWPSGAKSTERININTKHGNQGEYTLSRPVDAPGLDRDLPSNASSSEGGTRTTICSPMFGSVLCY